MTPQNDPHAHVHHRIAEAVGKGWPAWEVTAADVAVILEDPRRERRHRPAQLVEAVLAEAIGYGLASQSDVDETYAQAVWR